jgi:hypothetical protein
MCRLLIPIPVWTSAPGGDASLTRGTHSTTAHFRCYRHRARPRRAAPRDVSRPPEAPRWAGLRRTRRSSCRATGRLRCARCVKDFGLEKLATRADHRTNPSATYIGLGLSRRPTFTNLATTLELRPAMQAKPGGSGPTGAKDIKLRHHDDDQQCL